MGATLPHAKILTYINDNLAGPRASSSTSLEYRLRPAQHRAQRRRPDANFFQTVPYLENAEKQFGYDFEAGERSTSSPRRVLQQAHVPRELPDGGTIGIISRHGQPGPCARAPGHQGLRLDP